MREGRKPLRARTGRGQAQQMGSHRAGERTTRAQPRSNISNTSRTPGLHSRSCEGRLLPSALSPQSGCRWPQSSLGPSPDLLPTGSPPAGSPCLGPQEVALKPRPRPRGASRSAGTFSRTPCSRPQQPRPSSLLPWKPAAFPLPCSGVCLDVPSKPHAALDVDFSGFFKGG